MGFVGNPRGQSVVIGSLLVFTVLVLSFSGYQAFVVPNQNEEAEFNHYVSLQNDLQELRTAVLNAGATGELRSANVRLGTTYPDRALGVNGPPASGTLETVAVGDTDGDGAGEVASAGVNLTSACGAATAGEVETRHVVYRPGYNYYTEDAEQRIENTVYYQAGDDTEPLNRTGQQFIQPATNTIKLFPLRDEFSRSGVTSSSIDFVGGKTGEVEQTGTFSITVPTRLTDDQWDALIPGQDLLSSSGIVEITGSTSDTVTFTFSSTNGSWTVRCQPVGVSEAPAMPNEDAIQSPADGGGGGGGGDDGSTNPSSQQETLVWRSATVGNNEAVPNVTFENTGTSPIRIQEVRYQFFSKDSQGSSRNRQGIPKSFRIKDYATGAGTSWVNYIQPFEDVSGTLTDIPGGTSATYEFEFNEETDGTGGTFNVDKEDFFVVTVKFTIDGETKQATYFIGVSPP